MAISGGKPSIRLRPGWFERLIPADYTRTHPDIERALRAWSRGDPPPPRCSFLRFPRLRQAAQHILRTQRQRFDAHAGGVEDCVGDGGRERKLVNITGFVIADDTPPKFLTQSRLRTKLHHRNANDWCLRPLFRTPQNGRDMFSHLRSNNFGSAAWTDASRHIVDNDQFSANPKVLFDPPFYEFRVADFTLTIIMSPSSVFHPLS